MRRLQNLRSGLQGQESARSRPQLQACLRYGEWHLPQAQALASVDLLQSLRRAGVRHQLSDDSDAQTPGGWCSPSGSYQMRRLPVLHLGLPVRGTAVQSSARSEEHTSELQSLMRISYAVFCLQKKKPYISYY